LTESAQLAQAITEQIRAAFGLTVDRVILWEEDRSQRPQRKIAAQKDQSLLEDSQLSIRAVFACKHPKSCPHLTRDSPEIDRRGAHLRRSSKLATNMHSCHPLMRCRSSCGMILGLKRCQRCVRWLTEFHGNHGPKPLQRSQSCNL
jgi:hypothetical protein